MSKVVLLMVVVCAFAVLAQNAKAQDVTQGSLLAHDKGGKEMGACPLKSTNVRTEISGFVARVNVRQEFENPFAQAIEAVYTFPLSQNGAVDDMTMTVGTRIIRGKIMKREEARAAYEAAKTEGKTASLLDQERPNIFTQSVANIMPGEKVVVEVSYVETLKYEDGAYEFVFPMTIGPRYTPGSVKDASKIKPTYARSRPGHDISIEVNLNAGVPVEAIRSMSHEIQQVNFAPNTAKVTLRNEKTIPNKDFILRYDVTGGKIQDAVLTHRDERGGFFTMILQPPDKVAAEDRTPKEIVFVLDTSGSMSGFPIEKAKEAMILSLQGLYPDDTFNLITFAGDTEILFPEPVPATQANLAQAIAFLETRSGGGGTEMMKAIKAALDPSDSKEHLRIVCFMTDGYVGNEEEIIGEVQKHPNARVFSFGIGSSVNRYLLDKIAEAGRGEAEYVSLTDDGSKAARKFYERVRTPLLTDLSIDWNGLPVTDVYPGKLTDLFSAKPVIIYGRYTKPMSGKARLKGKVAGQEYVHEIVLNLPESEAANDSLASLWARTRIDELSSGKLRAENAAKVNEFDRQLLDLGLEFRLMTSFTSFVAVEDRIVNHTGTPTTVQVPVAIPEGVDAVTTADSSLGNILPKSKANISFNGGLTGLSNGPGSGSGTGSGTGSAAGHASAAVTVTSGSETLATQTATVGTNIQGRQIMETPVQSRDAMDLVTLLPGTSSAGVVRTSSINGLPKSATTIRIDGVDVQDNFLKSSDGFFVLVPDGNGTLPHGRALVVVEPVYPDEAKAAKVKGEVKVKIVVDPDGAVVSAAAVSGPKLLMRAAEKAAKATQFAAAVGKEGPVRTSRTLVYKFAAGGKTEIFLSRMTVLPPTEADLRARRLSETMHFWLHDAHLRVRRGIAEPSPNEAKFIRDGKALIRIELKVPANSINRKLVDAGFELDWERGNSAKGRIPIIKLAALAEIPEVRYVLPIY